MAVMVKMMVMMMEIEIARKMISTVHANYCSRNNTFFGVDPGFGSIFGKWKKLGFEEKRNFFNGIGVKALIRN